MFMDKNGIEIQVGNTIQYSTDHSVVYATVTRIEKTEDSHPFDKQLWFTGISHTVEAYFYSHQTPEHIEVLWD